MSVCCVFCGRRLEPGPRPESWRCAGCHALFDIERNERGCMIGVRVADCGAGAECCRQRASRLRRRRTAKAAAKGMLARTANVRYTTP